MRVNGIILAAPAGTSLTACAPTTWQRNGVPQAQVYEDLDECGRIARRYTLTYASGAGLGFTRMQPYRDYRHGSTFWFDRQFDRQMTETQVRQSCMREKGYTLAPTEP